MACALTQGRAIDCRNSTGGISEILIANFGDITIDTVAVRSNHSINSSRSY